MLLAAWATARQTAVASLRAESAPYNKYVPPPTTAWHGGSRVCRWALDTYIPTRSVDREGRKSAPRTAVYTAGSTKQTVPGYQYVAYRQVV